MTLLITLPDNFSADAFLSFHRRDAQAISEFVEANTLYKAVMLKGSPLMMSFTFINDAVELRCSGTELIEGRQRLANHMLGLNQPTDEFEAHFVGHRDVGDLIKKQSGLRVPQSSTPFEALSWAIMGQQISVAAAVSIRRRMIIAAGQALVGERVHYAYPEPTCLLALGHDGLKACGFSESKAATMIRVCQLIIDHQVLPESVSSSQEADALVPVLAAIKGIGPWTISYTLLRGYAWLDGSLHGDVAVRRNLQPYLSLGVPPTAKATEMWLAEFSPWRALMAAHLWQSQSVSGF